MGATCCKTKKFEGEGHRLNEMKQEELVTKQPTRNTTIQKPNATMTTESKSKERATRPMVTEPNKSHQTNNEDPRFAAAEAAEARAKAAKAAEARAKAAKVRGTKGGKISKSLSQLPADGGRVENAISEGTTPSNHKPLIWD